VGTLLWHQRCYFLVAVATVLAHAGELFAAESPCPDVSHATPAMIIDNDYNRQVIGDLVKPWQSEESSRIVVAEGFVTKKGRPTGVFIVKRTFRPSSFGSLIHKIQSIKLKPARIGTEPVAVHTSFTILATMIEGELSSVLVLNRSHYVDEFGLYYTSPQRLAYRSLWPIYAGNWLFEVAVNVGADGAVTLLPEQSADLETHDAIEHITKFVMESCFISGQVRGKSLDMLYVERFGRRRESNTLR